MFKKLLISIWIIFLIGSINSINCQDDLDDLPKLLGASNAGTEFWFTIPPSYIETRSELNFIKIFVTSSIKTEVTVEVPGKGYHRVRSSIPNDIIEFNITPEEGQCWQKQNSAPSPPEKVYEGAGIHINADYPIVVYCMVRYQANSDGFLVIPISSLGNEYICASYPDMSAMYPQYKIPSLCGMVAAFDNTEIEFTLGGTDFSKTSGGLLSGQTATVTLDKGDVWLMASEGKEADLSGSKIKATKPIAVVSGNNCANIPTNNRWCDYIVEMDIPTFAWEKYYHVPVIPQRKYPSIVRIFAKEDDSEIFRDGFKIGEINSAGGVKDEGFLEMRMLPMESVPRPVVFHSDKVIAVTLYNTGVQEDGFPRPNSDPFMMTIQPQKQFQKEITFCTPGVSGSGFKENYINIVYQTDKDGNVPDDLMFADVNNGEFRWKKVSDRFPGDEYKFIYDIDDVEFGNKIITLPNDGVYKLKANNPFGAYSFGYSSYDSYGYLTAGSFIDQDVSDFIAPKVEYVTKTNGDIEGTVDDNLDPNSKNEANLGIIMLYTPNSENFELTYGDFIPGETSSTWWKLVPIDRGFNAKATVIFADRSGNSTNVSLTYSGKVSVNDNNLPGNNIGISPNPVKDRFDLNFTVYHSSQLSIDIINSSGDISKVLMKDQYIESGEKSFSFNVSDLSSGQYFIKISTGKKVMTKKLIIVK